jgi:ribokinase
MNGDSSFDFVGIGDTVVDAFIRLSVGHIQESANGTELCMPYGAKVPFESVTVVPAVGNSANASVCASRLGLKSALVSFLGNDANGKACIERLERENVSTKFVTLENNKPTNYHYVLWYENDRTILIKHTEFITILPDVGEPKWIYLSSLGEYSKTFHFVIAEYMKSHPNTKLAFQPGTFQLRWKTELASLYKEVDVLCMNKEEAEVLLDMGGEDIKKLLDGLQALGPQTVIITNGPRGSFMKDYKKYYSLPVYPDSAPPFERTGAGDAFFSTFISYLAKGKESDYAIMRAPINAMNVVQKIGAQEGLLSEKEIEEYLKKAPENYKLLAI